MKSAQRWFVEAAAYVHMRAHTHENAFALALRRRHLAERKVTVDGIELVSLGVRHGVHRIQERGKRAKDTVVVLVPSNRQIAFMCMQCVQRE